GSSQIQVISLLTSSRDQTQRGSSPRNWNVDGSALKSTASTRRFPRFVSWRGGRNNRSARPSKRSRPEKYQFSSLLTGARWLCCKKLPGLAHSDRVFRRRKMNIHILSVGCGNMAILLNPDGTRLVIDCNLTEDNKDDVLD